MSPLLTNATKLRYYENMENEEDIKVLIKKYGLRLTETRQAILLLFFRWSIPLSASKILSALAKKGQATIADGDP